MLDPSKPSKSVLHPPLWSSLLELSRTSLAAGSSTSSETTTTKATATGTITSPNPGTAAFLGPSAFKLRTNRETPPLTPPKTPDPTHPSTATTPSTPSMPTPVVLSRPLGIYYARGFAGLSSFSSLLRLRPRLPHTTSNTHIAKQQLHGQPAVSFRGSTHHQFKLPLHPHQTAAHTAEDPMTFKKQRVVKIVEVGARDGLQNEKGVVPTKTKIELIEKLSEAGLRHIEAGSFVSPKWVPQMADTAQIQIHLNSNPPPAPVPVTYSYLTPNMQGLTSYLSGPPPPPSARHTSEIAIFASASEGFSKKNINCTIEESLNRFRPVVQKALEEGIKVRGYVSMIIECPYDGPTPPEKVGDVVEEMLKMGCYEVSLGDTNGVGTPGTIGKLVNHLVKERGLPAERLAAHFHDTYGQAIVNCLVALEAGISTFDSSIAGLGGCPYSKGATGNVATEDLVYFLEGTGVKTNVDLQEIVEIGDWISKELGRKNESKVGTALMARKGAKL